MGRKKNQDRPIELQTSPINLRVTNEARKILNNVPKYNRGKWLSERVSSQLYTRQELNAYATEKVKEALKLAAERACDSVELFQSEYDELEQSIISLETELIEIINKEK